MKRLRPNTQVEIEYSKHGHKIIRFDGPTWWAVMYFTSTRIIVRHGDDRDRTIANKQVGRFALDKERQAVDHCRRYARRVL